MILGRPRIYSDTQRKIRAKEYAKQYRELNREKFKLANKKYYYKNLAKEQERNRLKSKKSKQYANIKKYRAKHSGIANFYNKLREASKLKATPKWLTQKQLNEIKEIYINCPIGYVVDHIIPLQGKNVRGLHVSWNLQYLTKKENSIKNNKCDSTYENNGWRINL